MSHSFIHARAAPTLLILLMLVLLVGDTRANNNVSLVGGNTGSYGVFSGASHGIFYAQSRYWVFYFVGFAQGIFYSVSPIGLTWPTTCQGGVRFVCYEGGVLPGLGCFAPGLGTPYCLDFDQWVMTNAETTLISTMSLLDYYKLVYPGDVNFDGSDGLADTSICALRYGSSTGGNGNNQISAKGYSYMCDQRNFGTVNLADFSLIGAFYGVRYSNWDFTSNGSFGSGNLNGWYATPGTDDLAVMTSPLYDGDAYSLKIADAVNGRTTVYQSTLNPTSVYGAFSAMLGFWLPSSTAMGYATLEVSFGPYQFWIQPSSSLFGSSYDCYALNNVNIPSWNVESCGPTNFFTRNGWNTVSVTRYGNNSVRFFINGQLESGPGVDSSLVSSLSFFVDTCNSVFISFPPSCNETMSSSYYYVDGISVIQNQ